MKHRTILNTCVGMIVLAVCVMGALQSHVARADDKEKEKKATPITLGEQYEMTAPTTWVTRQPRSRIIDHEFSVPKAEGDELDGRVTIMAAAGTVDANLDRWYAQFKQPDGASTKEKAKVEKKKIAGKEVTIVDIAGTYTDRPSPMEQGVDRENYRMLAAIIPGKETGNHFVKFYGPKQTVADNAEAFKKMLDSLQQK